MTDSSLVIVDTNVLLDVTEQDEEEVDKLSVYQT